jgi:hypothetical protein
MRVSPVHRGKPENLAADLHRVNPVQRFNFVSHFVGIFLQFRLDCLPSTLEK